MNNIEYQIAHSLRELRDWTSKGYKFLAVLDPNDWLMIKEEKEEKVIEEEPIEHFQPPDRLLTKEPIKRVKKK